MPRPDKVQAVEDIKARIEAAEATFLAEYRGLTVPQQQDLRRKLREAQSEFSVVKMSLARLAVSKLGHEDLHQWLMGPTAIAFADDDPVLTAKALRNFSEDHEQLILKAGLLGGQIIEPEQVQALSRIDSRDVLLAKVVGTGKASLVQLVGLVSALIRDAASMFRQLADQESKAELAASQEEEAAASTEEPETAESPEEDSEVTDEELTTDEEPAATDAQATADEQAAEEEAQPEGAIASPEPDEDREAEEDSPEATDEPEEQEAEERDPEQGE